MTSISFASASGGNVACCAEQLRFSSEFKRFADEELRAVLTLLAGPGVV
jgi:hypothetical protein